MHKPIFPNMVSNIILTLATLLVADSQDRLRVALHFLITCIVLGFHVYLKRMKETTLRLLYEVTVPTCAQTWDHAAGVLSLSYSWFQSQRQQDWKEFVHIWLQKIF